MKTINEHINNQTFEHFYLLWGDEAYLINQCLDNLKKALINEDDGMNYSYYTGKKFSEEELVSTAETLPFFAERRVIVVEDAGYCKSAPEMLLERMDDFPDTTYIIFVEHEMDKRSRFYKKIKSVGYDAELTTPDVKTLGQWVNQRCKRENFKMDADALSYFVQNMGTDMMTLDHELEKLLSYTLEQKVITLEDVKEICIGQIEDKIFDMLDAIGNKNQAKAMSRYHDLLDLKEPSMKILSLLIRQYRILVIISKMKNEGASTNDMVRVAGIRPFTVKNYLAQVRQYKYSELLSNLARCQDVETQIKTGEVSDLIGVEMLIMEFCRS